MNKLLAILGLSLLLISPPILWAAGAQDYKEGGMALFRAGQYGKALVYFQNAVQADSNDAEAYEDLGNTYAKLNDIPNARNAYEKSLQINPNNSTLRVLLDNLGSANPPPSSPAHLEDSNYTAPAPANPPPSTKKFDEDGPITNNTPSQKQLGGINRIDKAKLWIKLEGALNYSVQADLVNSATAQNQFIKASPGATGSALADPLGGMAGAEMGLLINPNSGIAIGLRGIRTTDYSSNLNLQNGPATVAGTVYDSDFENETFTPSVYPLTLDYYLFLPDAGGRFFISGGVGYYYGLVHVEDNYSYVIYNNDPNVSDTFSGDLTSGNVGFQVSIGRDFAVGRDLALSIFARGRYARLTNFRGTIYNPNTGGSANDGLAVYSDGSVHSTDVSNIGNNGVTYANIDFSGFDLGVALTFFSY